MIVRIDLDIISIVDFLIDVFVHFCLDFRFVGDSNMQSIDPLSCTKIIFTKIWKIRFVETIYLNLVLDGVYDCVVHNGLDTLLLCDFEELVSIGGAGEIFS